jgi:sugar O-acyltransferase (sialic acid O-acetyltransferase NeuD family)
MVTRLQPLLVLGTREISVEVAELADHTGRYRTVGFVENMDRERTGKPLVGLPVHWVDDIAPLAETHVAVCGLSTTRRDRFVEQVRSLGLRFATVIHQTAFVPPSATVGEGSIVSANTTIGSYAVIGDHVFVSRGSIVGHNTVLEDYVTVSPGAQIAGMCRVEEAAWISIGAVVIDRITVGAHSVVGAGAVVVRDVPAHTQVVGVPARVVKEGIEGR